MANQNQGVVPSMANGFEVLSKSTTNQERVEGLLSLLHEERVVERIWQEDNSLWPSSVASANNSLGWLDVMDKMLAETERIEQLVDALCEENYAHAVLIGMGGASLASEVLRSVFGVKPGYLNLTVLDSNMPLSLMKFTEAFEATRTLFIICSKSGTTIETTSLFCYFYQWMCQSVGKEQASQHFIAITDPETDLEATARALNFRKIFLNDPNIKGHYSALSYFGMVPAALAGIDIVKLLQSGKEAALQSQQMSVNSPSAWLAAIITSYAQAGQDKISFITSAALKHFGAWLEQLIAVSLGKQGSSIFPVEGEALLKPRFYRHDRLFFYLRMVGDSALDTAVEQLRAAEHPVFEIDIAHLTSLGTEFFQWQMACAIASHLIGINPFEQPNITQCKVAVEKRFKEVANTSTSTSLQFHLDQHSDAEIGAALSSLMTQLPINEEQSRPLPYIALLSCLPATEEIEEALTELRTQLQRRLRLATGIDHNPRFLHSTAEMHLGGSGPGIFVQLVTSNPIDLPIPSASGEQKSQHTFGELVNAQSDAYWQLLNQNQKQLFRLHLGDDSVASLQRVIDFVRHWEL